MKKLGFLYIFIACTLWGTAGIFSHYLTPFGFSPLNMTAFRGLVSALFLFIYLLIYKRELFKVTLNELLIYFFTGLGIMGTATFYFTSMRLSSVSTAVVLMYTAPVIVMIYSIVFFKEKLTFKKALSVILMLIGCILVSGIIGSAAFNKWGLISGLLSGISYSAYNILTKIEMQKKLNPLTANFYSLLFMGLLALFFSNIREIGFIFLSSPFKTIPLVTALGIFTCTLPYFFYTLGLKELPAGSASALGIIEPMSATIFSVLFLGEVLSFYTICGIVFILGAVFMLGKSEK